MSTFIPSHEPPTWWERCLANPVILIALWSCLVAAQVIVDPWVTGFQPSPSLGELPRWTAAGLALFIGAGGSAAIVGILAQWDNQSRAWAVERAGWILASAGWVAYAVVVIHGFPGSTISWGSAIILAAVGVLRFTALVLIERRARKVKAEISAVITGPQEVVHPHE